MWGLSVSKPVLESVCSKVRWGAYFTRSVLTSVFVGRRVSLIRPLLQSVSSLSGSGVSLKHPVLEFCASLCYTMPRAAVCLVVKRVGSFSYSPRVGICYVVRQEGSIAYTSRASMCLYLGLVGSLSYKPRHGMCVFVRPCRSAGGEISLTRPVLETVWSFVGWGVLPDMQLAVIFLVFRRVGSFSYTPHAGICLVVRRMGNLYYTSRAAVCLIGKRIRSFSDTPRANLSRRSSDGESLLHVPFWYLLFSV